MTLCLCRYKEIVFGRISNIYQNIINAFFHNVFRAQPTRLPALLKRTFLLFESGGIPPATLVLTKYCSF